VKWKRKLNKALAETLVQGRGTRTLISVMYDMIRMAAS
jgi:hypothetical protein